MTRITLEPASLLRVLPSLLPESSTVQSQHEACTVLIHAVLTALGLQLVGVEESASGEASEGNVLPRNWNARAPDFTLKYKHSASTAVVLLKLVKIGNRTRIHGIEEKTELDASLDVVTADYVSPSYFPTTSSSDSLVHGFVSADRIAEFVSRLNNDLIKVLLPDLVFDIAEAPQEQPPPGDAPPPRAAPSLQREEEPFSPLMEPPRQPYNPGRRNPLEIGRDDLDPFPSPFAPPPLFGGNRGGGMMVGPNHPIFDGRGQRGPWGGDGFLPPLGAPPGARFDPVGPFGRGGFPGAGRGGFPGRGGRGGGAFGGDPDNDEFMPPGNFGSNFGGPGGDMYM